jgi:hypothetical protein
VRQPTPEEMIKIQRDVVEPYRAARSPLSADDRAALLALAERLIMRDLGATPA